MGHVRTYFRQFVVSFQKFQNVFFYQIKNSRIRSRPKTGRLRNPELMINLHVMIKNDVLYASIWFQQLLGVPKHALCVPYVVWKMLNSVYGYGPGFILDLNISLLIS